MRTGQRYAQKIIKKLQMKPHPEGGFYSETYRSPESASVSWSRESPRNFSTAIYFLLKAGQFSAWHRLHSDEMWHHYEGGDVKIHVIDPKQGSYQPFFLEGWGGEGDPKCWYPGTFGSVQRLNDVFHWSVAQWLLALTSPTLRWRQERI